MRRKKKFFCPSMPTTHSKKLPAQSVQEVHQRTPSQRVFMYVLSTYSIKRENTSRPKHLCIHEYTHLIYPNRVEQIPSALKHNLLPRFSVHVCIYCMFACVYRRAVSAYELCICMCVCLCVCSRVCAQLNAIKERLLTRLRIRGCRFTHAVLGPCHTQTRTPM